MPIRKLKEFLEVNGVKYVTITHSLAFTAQEIAASAHVAGHEMAKTVMVQIDGAMAMVVLPANRKVNLSLLREVSGADRIELATEEAFKDLFPDCEVGAMPPFGNLYGLDVYAADCLAENELIVFNAGSHSELIQLPYRDFERLVEPRIVQFR